MRIASLAGLVALTLAPISAAQTVVVDSAACRALVVTHRPSDDTAYKPGVDARGRPVAPADLGAPAVPVLTPSFTFDLNADLAPYLPRGSRLFEPQLGVGRVTIGPGGAVTFNGQPLAPSDAAALAAACRRGPR